MDAITTTYRDIVLTHDELTGQWTCDLFTKPSQTIREAKERIDKKLDTEKKAPFKRFNAFVPSFGYRNEGAWRPVEINSITDDGKEAWCSRDGKREKQILKYCYIYPTTPENSAIVAEILRMEQEIKEIRKRIQEETEKLTKWTPDTLVVKP